MSLRIGENHRAERDAHGWKLISLHEGMAYPNGRQAAGVPEMKERVTYHASLKQVLRYVLDAEAGLCESLVEVRATVERMELFASGLER